MTSDQSTLSDSELHEIENSLRNGSLREAEQLDGWVSRLLAEVKAARDANAPHKHHGDALLDHSGSRQGAAPRKG
jgi:hypothetical protein